MPGAEGPCRGIEEHAIDRLPELIAELRQSVEANGGSVYVADESPSHIVGPAIDKSRAAISNLFEERFDPDRVRERRSIYKYLPAFSGSGSAARGI